MCCGTFDRSYNIGKVRELYIVAHNTPPLTAVRDAWQALDNTSDGRR